MLTSCDPPETLQCTARIVRREESTGAREAHLHVEREVLELQELRERSHDLALDHVRLARLGAAREQRALLVLDALQVLQVQVRVPAVAQVVLGELLRGDVLERCLRSTSTQLGSRWSHTLSASSSSFGSCHLA